MNYNNEPCQINPPALPPVNKVFPTNILTPEVSGRNSKPKINADILAKELVSHCKIIKIHKALYVYNQKHWELTSDEQFRGLIMRHCRETVETVGYPSIITQAIQFIHDMPELEAGELKINEYLVSFDNCVYNIMNGQLYTHCSDIFVDKSLTVAYNTTDVTCPFFDGYINDLGNNNPQLIKLIWQTTGYLLSNLCYKYFFVLSGSGDTGKSLYTQIIASFFDNENVSHLEISQLGDRFLLAELANKAINISADLPQATLNTAVVSVLKMITGGDTLTVQKKYERPFTTSPRCKLLFASNHKIRLDSNDPAFYNRMVIIPCLNPIPKERQNHNLLDLIQTEKPAIAVKALKALQEGIQSGCLFKSVSDDCIDQNNFIQVQCNVNDDENISSFTTEKCLIDKNNESLFTATADLFAEFCKFCNETGRESYLIGNMGNFSRKLNSTCNSVVLYKKRCGDNKSPISGYRYIALKSE